jgi:hypothetical protein
VDADIASALLLEIPNEFDQPAVDTLSHWPNLGQGASMSRHTS